MNAPERHAGRCHPSKLARTSALSDGDRVANASLLANLDGPLSVHLKRKGPTNSTLSALLVPPVTLAVARSSTAVPMGRAATRANATTESRERGRRARLEPGVRLLTRKKPKKQKERKKKKATELRIHTADPSPRWNKRLSAA